MIEGLFQCVCVCVCVGPMSNFIPQTTVIGDSSCVMFSVKVFFTLFIVVRKNLSIVFHNNCATTVEKRDYH